MMMMNIMGVIPFERYVGREVSSGHPHVTGVHRVPQGEEDSRNEQNHPKKLWDSTYKNNFDRFKKQSEKEGQSSYYFENTVDVLEISQEALELFFGNNMTNASRAYGK